VTEVAFPGWTRLENFSPAINLDDGAVDCDLRSRAAFLRVWDFHGVFSRQTFSSEPSETLDPKCPRGNAGRSA